ncbi:MAG: TRAP transporter fused permease subunit [Rhodospirillales bacterium]|nr:TRAP transporter fused permease subunit [Rhodospirillales bacterium]
MALGQSADQPAVADRRHRRLSFFWTAVAVSFTVLTVVLAVDQVRVIFGRQWLGSVILLTNHYLYAILGLLLPLTFIFFPAGRRARRDGVPWYDAALFAVSLGVCLFFFLNAVNIVDQGWEFVAPDHAIYASYLLWLLVLEAVRRAGGIAIFTIVLVLSLYPIFADRMPGPIAGLASTLGESAAYHTMSIESILGIPMRAFAELVIGFLIFGVALQHSGGGKFFLNLAFALLGGVRGGAAKVSIFASGLMGSMSGSVITNVLTTGVMTIPAMRRTGFRPAYAGGVEACASTGGVLMPPVMGATAFIMATIIEVPYVDIAVAAIIPSALYFFGLFVQIDAAAARQDLKGLPREELPALGRTLTEGWYFVLAFTLLVFMLVYLRREALAPFYATAILIALNQIFPHNRWGRKQLLDFVVATGKLLTELTAILAAVGLIVGALSMTGMAGTLVNDLVFLAGGSVLVLLLMGAVTSFIMGIGMTVTAAYIFLAIILAPALIQGGLSPMAVHLFILYWGMMSYITPPVALGAFAAAALAQASPMRTGLEAMRLGSIIYFIPFFFVLEPALILDGAWPDILLSTASAFLGIVLAAGALQGYLLLVGDLTRHAVLQWPLRVLILLAGLLLAMPGGGLVPWSDLQMAGTAALFMGCALTLVALARRRSPAAQADGPAP